MWLLYNPAIPLLAIYLMEVLVIFTNIHKQEYS